MNAGLAIRLDGVSKSFGAHPALEDVSLVADAGKVTGFIGRNGAGKTTALRIVLGLAMPDAGSATIGGAAIRALPAGTVGALLEPGMHPGRSGRAHLRAVAAAIGADPRTIEDVLGEVGLARDGGRRVRGYSLGMRQRLALAAALLGDPPVLVLDEPANGLDPDGLLLLRRRLRAKVDAGGTVLVSSHNLLELEQIVDEVIVLDRRVLWAGSREQAASRQHASLEELFHAVATPVAA